MLLPAQVSLPYLGDHKPIPELQQPVFLHHFADISGGFKRDQVEQSNDLEAEQFILNHDLVQARKHSLQVEHYVLGGYFRVLCEVPQDARQDLHLESVVS